MDHTTYTITPDHANQRLDRFLLKRYKTAEDITLSTIYQWIRTGQVKINGRRAKENSTIVLDDEVTLPEVEAGPVKRNDKKEKLQIQKILSNETIKKMILFEDDNRIVWNKPPHIVIHANTNTGSDWTMHDIMMTYTGKSNNRSIERSDESNLLSDDSDHSIVLDPAHSTLPSFCFRLDRDTSGVLIAAKTYVALQHLNELIRDRKVQKEYLTIVTGAFPSHKVMAQSLTKVVDKKFARGKMVVDPAGKESKTEARCEKTRTDDILGQISLLRVQITTGRMHQIRVHLAYTGHPVVGDLVYGHPTTNRKLYKKYKIKRQLLHCQRYTFIDIDGKKLSLEAPVPEDIQKIISTIPKQ